MSETQYLCQEPGCVRPVNGNRGLAAYCSDHRKRGPVPAASNGLVSSLDSLKTLARTADRLEAKAKKLRTQADSVMMQAGDARDSFAEKLKELTQ